MDLIDYIFYVRTGDRKNAGTDANIKVILYGDSDKKTDKIKLHNTFRNDFERGQLDTFEVKAPFSLSRFKVPVHPGLMIRDEP